MGSQRDGAYPCFDRGTRLLCQFELYRSARFLLNNRGAGQYATTVCDVLNLQPNQITPD